MTAPLFDVRVRLSTDAPYVSSPTWTDITAYVDIPSYIKFKRGRPDVLSEVDAGDCTFTLTNVDGRFTTANASGAYYPNLRKNNRIEISVRYPSAGTYYVRYVGYVNAWPNNWEGKDAKAEVSCTDIFKIIERRANSRGNYGEEVIKNQPVAHYPLDEVEPSTTFGNVNINSSIATAAAPLSLVTIRSQVRSTEGVNVSTGTIDLSNQLGAPDSGTGVKFNPVPGIHNGGVLIQGNLPTTLPTNWAIEFWMYADGVQVPAGQYTDYATILNFNATTRLASSLSIGVDAGKYIGNLIVAQEAGSTSAFTSVFTRISDRRASLANSELHMVTLEYTNSTHTLVCYVDGVQVASTTSHTFLTTMQLMTVGGQDDRALGRGVDLAHRLRHFSGSVSNVTIFNKSSGVYAAPSVRYLAGQGWTGELVQPRIVRLLGYAGLVSSQYTISAGTSMVGQQWTRGDSLLNAAQQSAAVEDMPLFVDSGGKVHFDGRTKRSGMVFSGALTIGASEFSDISFADDDAFLINVVEVEGTKVGKQTFSNLNGSTTSITNYGEYRKTISGLPFYTDNQACDLARKLLKRFADPIPRLNSITLENAALLSNYTTILGVEPNDGLRITGLNTVYPNHGIGVGANYDSYIEGIEETIGMNEHIFTFNTTGLTVADSNEVNNGDRNVWRLGQAGHQILGTDTWVD